MIRLLWTKEIKDISSPILLKLRKEKTSTFKLVATAFMGVMAAILQSAGSLIPAIGLLISPFATAPIIIGMLMGATYGFASYVLTLFLLLLIQPSELIVFPFTTGLLGIGIGLGLSLLRNWWQILSLSGFCLTIGISFLLYGVRFPILGPLLLDFNYSNLIIIFLFSCIYSLVWLEMIIKFLTRILKS